MTELQEQVLAAIRKTGEPPAWLHLPVMGQWIAESPSFRTALVCINPKWTLLCVQLAGLHDGTPAGLRVASEAAKSQLQQEGGEEGLPAGWASGGGLAKTRRHLEAVSRLPSMGHILELRRAED